jgi:CheY-like chemotaxis protein
MSRDLAPADLALLLGIAERLAATGNDRAALAELLRETQKIQGAAGAFGSLDASRLAAGMEATVRDWASRPDDLEVDRGSLTLWFVTRLAAMLKLEMPRRAAAPRPKPTGAPAPRRTAGIPTPPSAPVAPGPPKVPAPPPAPPRRLIIRRPSAMRPSPEPPAPVPTSASDPAPPPAPPPSRVEAPPPEPPPDARTQDLTWLIPPSEAFPADVADPVAPAATPEPLAESTPPTPPEAQLSLRFPPLLASPADAAPPVEPPAPEAPPAAAPPTPQPQPIAESNTEPQPIEVAATVAEVIFVEDDAALAELLEYGLQSRGYRFLSYRNGREALRELLALDVQGTRPLLLLDVDLPGLDGYSVFDALQRERPGTYRVVFTTVHGTEEEQLRGLEAGAVDYMVKPISLRVALEKIKRWVGK